MNSYQDRIKVIDPTQQNAVSQKPMPKIIAKRLHLHQKLPVEEQMRTQKPITHTNHDLIALRSDHELPQREQKKTSNAPESRNRLTISSKSKPQKLGKARR